MSEFDKTLNHVIYLLDSNPLGFGHEVQIIHDTDYQKKFLLEPFRNFSTTLGKRSVRLAYDWEKWEATTFPTYHEHFPRMANLIHEACHSMQRDLLGDWSFNRKYLLNEDARYQWELEAYKKQIQYLLAFFGMRKLQANPYIQNCADAISRYYFLSKKYHFGRAYSDLMDIL